MKLLAKIDYTEGIYNCRTPSSAKISPIRMNVVPFAIVCRVSNKLRVLTLSAEK